MASESKNLGVNVKNLKSLILKAEARRSRPPPLKKKAKNELRIRELEEILISTQTAFLTKRLFESRICLANRYAAMGDEIKLREEIANGHRINSRDPTTGRSILTEAVSAGHFHLVRILCSEYKVDVRVRSWLGNSTALHIAVECGYRQIASLLITYGADVNARDKRGCLPLHLVKNISIARLLFRYPVNALTRNREDLLPSQYYAKHVLPPEFNVHLEQYLIEKEGEHEAANYRARSAEHRQRKTQLALDIASATSVHS